MGTPDLSCKEYVTLNKGDDNNKDNVLKTTMVDEEGGGDGSMMIDEGSIILDSSKRNRIIISPTARISACIFFIGFLCGGVAVTMLLLVGGSRSSPISLFPENHNHGVGTSSGSGTDGNNPSDSEPIEKKIKGDVDQLATITDTFSVIEQVDHDASSFTQGLSYGYDNDGKLCIYETTGLYGRSKVRRIDPDTFAVVTSVDIDSAHFGEGSTFYTDADGNRRLIEITWKKQTGFVYDADTLEQLREFSYTTTAPGHEGWGITYDASAQEFIVSDGSANLHFWDRDTLAEKRSVRVTRLDGMEQDQLNELEYMDGLVCCNIWYSDDIICVDPESGRSVREYDMSSLWPADERSAGADVLNGIALGTDHVLITGKLWDRMYKVDFPNWPTLFASPVKDEATLDNVDKQPLNGDKGGYIDKGDDMAAVSYNFLRTNKGSQTMHLLLHDLFQSQPPLSPQQLNSSFVADNSPMSGPRLALTHLSELMESDGQIHSSCHPIAHNLGRIAYQYFGSLDAAYDGMVGTDDAHLLRLCNAAYLHGVIEFHLRDVNDTNDIASAAREIEETVCEKLTNIQSGPWECRHGIGHGIIQRYRLDAEKDTIKKGIDACKQTSVAIDCENGLWMDHFAVSGNIMAMENRMMAADVVAAGLVGAISSLGESQQGNDDLAMIQKRLELPPLPPTLQICSLGTTEFDCFTYAATQYLLVHPGDYIGALQYCTDPSSGISQPEVGICVRGVGAQCAKEHIDDFSVVEEACQTLDDGRSCFRSALTYYKTSSAGRSPKDADLCENLTRYKSLCDVSRM